MPKATVGIFTLSGQREQELDVFLGPYSCLVVPQRVPNRPHPNNVIPTRYCWRSRASSSGKVAAFKRSRSWSEIKRRQRPEAFIALDPGPSYPVTTSVQSNHSSTIQTEHPATSYIAISNGNVTVAVHNQLEDSMLLCPVSRRVSPQLHTLNPDSLSPAAGINES